MCNFVAHIHALFSSIYVHAVTYTCRVVEELLQWDRLKAVVNYRVLELKAVFKAKYDY